MDYNSLSESDLEEVKQTCVKSVSNEAVSAKEDDKPSGIQKKKKKSCTTIGVEKMLGCKTHSD